MEMLFRDVANGYLKSVSLLPWGGMISTSPAFEPLFVRELVPKGDCVDFYNMWVFFFEVW